MTVGEYLKRVTHREHLAWLVWFDEYDPIERYLVEIITETRRSWVKDPGKVEAEDFRLFRKQEPEKPEMTLEEAAAASKARWRPIMRNPRSSEADDGNRDGKTDRHDRG